MTDWTGQRKIYNIKVVVVIAIDVWFIQYVERRLKNVTEFEGSNQTTKIVMQNQQIYKATETDLAKVKEDGKQKDTFKTALAQLTGALRSIINHNRCQCVKIQRKNYAEMPNNDGTELLLNGMP